MMKQVLQHGTVNAEPGQELLGCVPTLQPFYGFWEMRGTGSHVDLEFEIGETLLTTPTPTPVDESESSEGELSGTEE